MEVGRFYLFAAPFFWTFVARYVRPAGLHDIVVDDVIYFTRPGATFDILTTKGLQPNSKYHTMRGEQLIPAQGPKFPWHAETPWVKAKKGK